MKNILNGILLILISVVLTDCSPISTHPSTIDQSETAGTTQVVPAMVATAISPVSETPFKMLIQTSTPQPSPTVPDKIVLEKSLLISYVPPIDYHAESDIWLLPPPYDKVQPFRLHNEEFAYSNPRWSQDGNWIAYLQTDVTRPSTTIWISRPDGKNHLQIGPEFATPMPQTLISGLETLYLYGWTSDGNFIVYFDGMLHSVNKINIATGEISEVPPRTPFWYSNYHAASDQILVLKYPSDRLVLDVTSFTEPITEKSILLPDDYSPSGRDVESVWEGNFSFSPTGQVLAALSFDRDLRQEGVWLVDLQTEQWSKVFEQELTNLAFVPEAVAWSDDMQWLATWEVFRDFSDYRYLFFVRFFNTDTWQSTETLTIDTPTPRLSYIPLGWTVDAENNPVFTIYHFEEGIIVLSIDNNQIMESNLTPGDTFSRTIPLLPKDVLNNYLGDMLWQP